MSQMQDTKDRCNTSIHPLKLKLCCETVFIDNILTKLALLWKQSFLFYIGNHCVKCKQDIISSFPAFD